MLGIIIVNYKTIERTAQYVREEIVKIKTPHKVVIVNNACTEEHNKTLSRACGAYWVPQSGEIDPDAGLFVLGAKENLGYARGNNLGVEFLRAHFDVDYLLFSNNDIVLKDEDVVERLIEKLEENNDIGLIGPSIINLDGKHTNPYIRPSIWRHLIVPNLFMPLLILTRQRNRMSIVDRSIGDGYCYRLGGCFMMTRTDLFDKAGMFDPATFLYCEEPILSERYLNIGMKSYYLGAVAVIHDHGFTAKQTHQVAQIRKMDFDSQLYYFRKYRGISGLVAGLAIVSFYVHAMLWSPLMRAGVIIRDLFLHR